MQNNATRARPSNENMAYFFLGFPFLAPFRRHGDRFLPMLPPGQPGLGTETGETAEPAHAAGGHCCPPIVATAAGGFLLGSVGQTVPPRTFHMQSPGGFLAALHIPAGGGSRILGHLLWYLFSSGIRTFWSCTCKRYYALTAGKSIKTKGAPCTDTAGT